MLISDVGEAKDAAAIQTNIVRVDGQHSVYLPILKQGGGGNTIAIVNGIRVAISRLLDIPKSLKARVVFDQSVFVKTALKNLGERRIDRPGFDRNDDPDLFRQWSGDDGGDVVDSIVGIGRRFWY